MDDTKAAVKALVRAFTWKPVARRRAGPGRGEAGRQGPPRGPADPRGRARRRRRRLPQAGREPGRRRHRPRGAARDPRGRGRRQEAADKHAAKFFNDMGGYAPTIGIIGTVMGLVHVLENLSAARQARPPDRRRVRRHPVGRDDRQRDLAADRQPARPGSASSRPRRMELVIEGVLAVQAGANPRVVAQRLQLAAARRTSATSSRRRPDMGSRRKRQASEHEEHGNHERWLVSYADMMTLLMVLFIVMFAISQVDQKRFEMLKDGMAAGFGSTPSPFQGSEDGVRRGGIKPLAPVRPDAPPTRRRPDRGRTGRGRRTPRPTSRTAYAEAGRGGRPARGAAQADRRGAGGARACPRTCRCRSTSAG